MTISDTDSFLQYKGQQERVVTFGGSMNTLNTSSFSSLRAHRELVWTSSHALLNLLHHPKKSPGGQIHGWLATQSGSKLNPSDWGGLKSRDIRLESKGRIGVDDTGIDFQDPAAVPTEKLDVHQATRGRGTRGNPGVFVSGKPELDAEWLAQAIYVRANEDPNKASTVKKLISIRKGSYRPAGILEAEVTEHKKVPGFPPFIHGSQAWLSDEKVAKKTSPLETIFGRDQS